MDSAPSQFIWYELVTTDPGAAARFYGAVLGWSEQDSGLVDQQYRIWMNGADAVGGLMALPDEAAARGLRTCWLAYLRVDDVDATVAAITAAGGAVHKPPTDIEGVGRFAAVGDPQGAAFYVMAPIGAGPSRAFLQGTPGHGGWHELHTTDWKAALAFYSALFGWTPSTPFDMGQMGVYQLFAAGGPDIGGMMNSPAAPRPFWLYYFNVADITAARARLEAAGGTVLHGPSPVPGGAWIIQARDPQGAMFALVGPGPAAANA